MVRSLAKRCYFVPTIPKLAKQSVQNNSNKYQIWREIDQKIQLCRPHRILKACQKTLIFKEIFGSLTENGNSFQTLCLVKFLLYPLDFQFKNIRMASKSVELHGNFHVKADIYKGVTIETRDLALSDEEFENNLKSSLMDWIKAGIRGVWFKVNIANSSYVPILVKHGFLFHHAKTSYVMLTRWLPADEPNLLPQYPYTHIGVGGMVINDKNQVLTIQEKYHQIPHWKLPGGYSNPGEEFGDTARREVFEETGIETKFVSVVALRHHHKHIFNCSDVYVVCHLKPVSETITKSNEEIAKCEWMDIEAYRNHPEVTEFNKSIIDAFLESRRLKTTITASSILSFRKDCYNKVYHVQSTDDS